MARNRLGQVTRVGNIEFKVTKKLQEIANEAEIRIRPLIRDQLESELRYQIYASFEPATVKGKATQTYNDTHKHQKVQSYHHTGILARSIHGTIDGNKVKAGPMDGYNYEDGTSAKKVYDILKFGTPKTSDKKGFYYNNHNNFSPYISQPPHNFEARTGEEIRKFLKNLANELETEAGKNKYISKYRNKRL